MANPEPTHGQWVCVCWMLATLRGTLAPTGLDPSFCPQVGLPF